MLDSTSVVELGALPPSMIIVGGSAVGLELGQVFARLTVIELLSCLLHGEDADAAAELRRQLEAEGMEIVTDARVMEVEDGSGRVAVHAETPDGRRTFEAELLLSATRVFSGR